MDGITVAWEEFSAKHPVQHEPQVLPDFTMKLPHLYLLEISLLHPDDAGRLLTFRARRTGVTAPYFE